MPFLTEKRLRWWAFRQFLHELALAQCWDDVKTSFMDEFVGTVIGGHMNVSDLCGLYEEFPELFGPGQVGLKALTDMAAQRLRAAAAKGLDRWGSYPEYCRAQEAHLHACGKCRDRLYDEIYEEVRTKVEIDSILRRAGMHPG